MASPSSSKDRWQRFYNEMLYDSFPFAYNALDRLTFGAWWSLVRRALDYIPPDRRVLEIGFGPGRLQIEIARQAKLCAGLDLARGMCRFTQRRLKRAGLPSALAQGSVYALPYPDRTFDVVVSTFAFSGLLQGELAMDEMVRVIAGEGRLVLVDIGLPASNNRLGNFLARLWERMGDCLYDQPTMMKNAGLEMLVIKEFGPGNHIRAVVGQKPGA